MIVYQDREFEICLAVDCFIPGYLVVFPRREVQSIADFNAEEQVNLGKILARSQQLIDEIVQPERIYTLVFAEIVRQVHFHLFPRTFEMKQEYLKNFPSQEKINAAELFNWFKARYKDKKYLNYDSITQIIIEKIATLKHIKT